MVQKINIKARLDRHSRIIRDDLSFKDKISSIIKKKKLWYKIVILFMVFMMPIYPIFASLIHNNTEYDFYRWYIDEDSILWSYYSNIDEQQEGESLYEAKDSFLSVTTVLDDDRDLVWTNEIIEYKIKSWDSISLIAHNFQVSRKSIYDSNNFTESHVIQPWDIIKIPPVSWIIHVVEKWDTISSIAKKYSVEVDKILTQNLLDTNDTVSVWEELVIPGWVKPVPKYVAPAKTYTNTTNTNKAVTTNTSWWYSFVQPSGSQYVAEWGTYKLTAKPSYHTFYRWNCTWYVAKYKTVNWWWNAKDWLKNAAAKWHATWSTPKLWSIIVFNGRWYNPKYGHVWIVMDIKTDGNLIISDMNYRKLWEITYRKVSVYDRAITWYIYVE